MDRQQVSSELMDSGSKYLDVIDGSVVASVALCLVARGRKGVWGERDEGATTRIGNVDVCDRDWEGERMLEADDGTKGKLDTHLVWSLK